MQIQCHLCRDLPVVIIDNLYCDESYDSMLEELVSLKPQLIDPVPELSGQHPDGSFKKINKSIFLDDIYQNRSDSCILTENRKLFSDEVVYKLIESHKFFKYLDISNSDSTLVSYYTNNGRYDKHLDLAVLTSLTWLYQEPKGFTGGDLIIEDMIKIECIKNRTVVFPSILEHQVEPVYTLNNSNGRYTISQFITLDFKK